MSEVPLYGSDLSRLPKWIHLTGNEKDGTLGRGDEGVVVRRDRRCRPFLNPKL